MYIFTIPATPQEDNTEIEADIAGALINIWINFPDEQAAELVARFYIAEAGWDAGETTEVNEVTEADYGEGDEDLVYYQDALRDGSCLVFHEWTKEAEDLEEAYNE